MKVLVVAPNISRRMGGEAALPYHCIRELANAGVETFGLTHARVRDELASSDIWRENRFYFVEDAISERTLFKISEHLPNALRETIFDSAINAVTLRRLATRARRVANDLGVDIIHQITPVSPRFPSFMTNMPAPVIIGPMNGNMAYPPALRRDEPITARLAVGVGRGVSDAANAFVPGKRTAARLLVANQRTRAGLPKSVRDKQVETLVENGVDLSLWTTARAARRHPPTFVFVGRLIPLKGVDILLDAFADLEREARLVIIGEGEERARLERRAAESRRAQSIEFVGFQPQSAIREQLSQATALVLPSLRDCGGAVILEAFACRTPAIATDWGGPQDYVTSQTGFLIAPTSRDALVAGLAEAMRQLFDDQDLVRAMGEAARRRVENQFSWTAKAQALLAVYGRVIEERAENR